MARLILILGDQLSRGLSSLRDIDMARDVILMAEVRAEATYVGHHKQKLVFIFSAMRHFAEELAADGYTVRYVRIDDAENSGNLFGEVERALAAYTDLDRVLVTESGEYRLHHDMAEWSERLSCPVEIVPDDRFVATKADFETWADGRKTLTMEYFYREMRKRTGLLMDGDTPVGGQWNFDADNRKKLPKNYHPPKRRRVRPGRITQEVIDTVEGLFPDNFGTLDGFEYAVTRDEALQALDHFIEDCLPDFGDYQDAMATGQDFINHSLIAAYINVGLLDPLEVCDAVVHAFEEGDVPLNAAEGYVRQIIGWREFIRGLYWLKMPAYKDMNALDAQRALPSFYWDADTDMHCVAEAVRTTRDNAYAHHIQRLMVTGNFALLAGIAPAQINEWYLAVYVDAFEWVQLPNTHGMAIWADGGIVGSKPYAASGAYINRMSNYCSSCRYKVSKKTGDDACPFNYLYWDFMIRNESQLRSNHRMGMVFRNLDRKDDAEREAIRHSAQRFLSAL